MLYLKVVFSLKWLNISLLIAFLRLIFPIFIIDCCLDLQFKFIKDLTKIK